LREVRTSKAARVHQEVLREGCLYVDREEGLLSMSVIRLFNADCLPALKAMPDRAFDLAIVDPPYFSGPERREFYGRRVSSIGVSRLYRKSDRWDLPTLEYFTELQRVAVHYIFWGCNYFNFPFNSGRIVWDKVNDSSSYSDCELAATNIFDHVRVFRYMWNGMLQGESATNGTKMQGNKKLNEIRIHPTQKPVALYKWLVTNYAKPGQTILDTHLGSGSIAIACHDLGFDLTGYEIDKEYFEAAKERLERHQRQETLPFTERPVIQQEAFL